MSSEECLSVGGMASEETEKTCESGIGADDQCNVNDTILLKDVNGDLEAEKTSPPKPSLSSNVATRFQWRPLGTVRDYFTEQMRQDELR